MPPSLVILALNAPNEEKVPVQFQQSSKANYCLWIEVRGSICVQSSQSKHIYRLISPARLKPYYVLLDILEHFIDNQVREREEWGEEVVEVVVVVVVVGLGNCGGGWHELWPFSAVHWPPCSPQPAGIRAGETPPTTPLVTLSTQSILIQKILFPDTKIILSPEIPLLDVGGCHHALW